MYIKVCVFLNVSDLSDTFPIKGTEEKITITISRQDDNDQIPVKTLFPSRKNSNTSNSSSRSSSFNVQFIQDDISSSGYSDPGVMSDNDLSPAASFHGSHEDLFTSKGTTIPSDTDDDFIEEDMPKSSSSRICSNQPPSPRTRSKVGCHCVNILCIQQISMHIIS